MLALLLYLDYAVACGPLAGVAVLSSQEPNAINAALRNLGGTTRVTDSINREKGNDQNSITLSTDLNCADWNTECRWRNELNSDQFDYGRGEGEWDKARGNFAFGTDILAEGSFAITGATDIHNEADKAMLVSNPITCQFGDGTLSFRYWTTQGAFVRVCVRPTDNGDKYQYCSPPISDGDPGPARVRIPGPIFETLELVIEANGFIYNDFGAKGGAVVIDDIEYEADICSNRNVAESSDQQQQSAQNGACQAIHCTFDTSSCPLELGNNWSVVAGDSFGNRHTGIRQPIKGKYAVAHGGSRDPTIKSPSFSLSEDQLMSFCYYRQSADADLYIYATENGHRQEIFKSPSFRIADQHQWLCEHLLITKGRYDSIEFVAERLRNQFSYMGLDEIQIYNTAEPNTGIC